MSQEERFAMKIFRTSFAFRATTFRALASATWVFLLLHTPVAAQETGAIRGVVFSSITGEPLVGVRVVLGEAEMEAVTGEDGRFFLSRVPAGDVRIRVEHNPDFVTTTEQVPVRPGVTTWVSVQLTPEAVFLDELLVRRRPAPSDAQVRTFRKGEAQEITGGGTAVDLLAATFSAVQVKRGSGQVGSGTSILIRGANSLIMSGDPLVYLDGVRMGAQPNPRSTEAPMVVSFLDQIPADIVVRIEVIKGPAATKYGVGSSNGVILIYTH
jgi:hypothetical protein